jgi:VIT1/CCC1 family predicted Fe2+/Mn2+ transporter
MKSWSQRELALAVLVVFAAPAIPYVTSRLLGDLSSLFLGTVPLIGTLLSLFLYACISALVTGGRFFSGPGEAAGSGLGSWLWRSAWVYSVFCV